MDLSSWVFAHDAIHSLEHGDPRHPRTILQKYTINISDYQFILENESGQWVKSSAQNCNAKLCLKKSWFLKHRLVQLDRLFLDLSEHCPIDFSEVDVRGALSRDKILFSAADIAKLFDSKNLLVQMVKESQRFIAGKHYTKIHKRQIGDHSKGNPHLLYLTFSGLVVLCHTGHSQKARLYADWIQQILWAHQFGSPEEKVKCAQQLTGISVESLRSCMNRHHEKMPCIYLLRLGSTRKLQQELKINIPEDHIIFKYGLSEDIRTRISSHKSTFKKFEVSVERFVHIDPRFLFDAEKTIADCLKKYCSAVPVKYKRYTEIVSFKPNAKHIKDCFDIVFKKHGGGLEEVELRHKCELSKYELKFKMQRQMFVGREKLIREMYSDREKLIQNILRPN